MASLANPASSPIENYVRENRLDTLIAFTAENTQAGVNTSVDPSNKTPFPPQWRDLVRLHRLVRDRKATTILEFGVGKSTIILADALAQNQADYQDYVGKHLRRNNPFELHAVDDMPEYISITQTALPDNLKDGVTLHFSRCEMGSFSGRTCSFYQSLPNISPDFIYLDAPSQFSVTGDIRGISTRHADRMPMAGDLLAIEHFLLPGCLIIVDGRTANARFLQTNFQRNWSYKHDTDGDIHIFELEEAPLGALNRRQIEFQLGADWLKRVESGTTTQNAN